LNDLPLFERICAALFADDIALWPISNGKRGIDALNKGLALIFDWSVEWHVIFSISKSLYMLFSRKRSPSSVSLFLGPSVLPQSHSSPYLGATLQPSLRWQNHCNRIISAAYKAAHDVSRIIIAQGPSPNVIRQLTLAMVLPVISYGWPFWSPPTARHWAKLESALCLPLRCCLALPANVHRLALFVEYGLPNLRILHQELYLAYAHRLAALPSSQLSRQLFYEQYNTIPSHTTPKSLIPFGQRVKSIEASWVVDHASVTPAFKRSLRTRALSLQLVQLRESPSSGILRNLSLKPAPTSYILLEPRQVAILRAKLRLNRNHLNHNRYRRKLTLSPYCPVCPSLEETGQHVLFSCPAFDAARYQCFNTLAAYGCPVTFEVLTGDVSSIPPRHRKVALAASAKLLQTINLHRPL